MEGEERIPTYLKVVQMQKDRLCNNGRKDLYHEFIGVMVGVYRDLFFWGWFRVYGFPKSGVPLWRHSEDYNMLGSRLGSPILGGYHRVWSVGAKVQMSHLQVQNESMFARRTNARS